MSRKMTFGVKQALEINLVSVGKKELQDDISYCACDYLKGVEQEFGIKTSARLPRQKG